MKPNESFCIECRESIGENYTVKQEMITVKRDGRTGIFKEYVCYCNKCNKEVYVPEYNDLNVKTYNDFFRRMRQNG